MATDAPTLWRGHSVGRGGHSPEMRELGGGGIFSNRFRGFPPPPDLPQNLLFLDVYMISTLIWWVMIPLGARFNHFSSVVIYVDIHFLGDFKCFSCFLRLLGMNHTYLLRLASGKSS